MNRPSHLTTDAELYSGSVARLASLFYDDLAELGRFEPGLGERAARSPIADCSPTTNT